MTAETACGPSAGNGRPVLMMAVQKGIVLNDAQKSNQIPYGYRLL